MITFIFFSKKTAQNQIFSKRYLMATEGQNIVLYQRITIEEDIRIGDVGQFNILVSLDCAHCKFDNIRSAFLCLIW